MTEEVRKVPDSLISVIEEIENTQHSKIDIRRSANNYLEIKAREKGVPLHGVFELTPLCNFDCKMCYVHLTPDQLGNQSLLTVEQWKLLIRQAVDAGMLDATLTGGECLTYPGFNEIYLYLHELGIRVSVMTNGVLMDAEKQDFFAKHPPALIQITLYGSNNEAYERITGRRAYEVVINNILAMKEKGLRLRLGVTPNRYMGKDDENIIRKLQELQIPFAVNNYLFEARKDTGRKLEDFDQEIEEFLRLKKLQYSGCSIPFEDDCKDNMVSCDLLKGMKCGGGNSGFNIDWKGDMYACSMLPDICAKPLITGFKAAWEDVHAQAAEYPNPAECVTCKYKKLCSGCVALHRSDALPGHASKRMCMFTKTLVNAFCFDNQEKEGDKNEEDI